MLLTIKSFGFSITFVTHSQKYLRNIGTVSVIKLTLKLKYYSVIIAYK